MTEPLSGRSATDAPKPGDYLVDESGCTTSWLAADYSPADIEDEWDIDRSRLSEVWFGLRWTTEAEKDDEDAIYDLFGDHEMTGVDTSVVYFRTKPNTPGAHRYWTTEP